MTKANSAESEKICLFIPTFNVDRSIRNVLERIPKTALDRISLVLIVDNGSRDRTLDEIGKFLESSNERRKFRLFANDQNYTLGGSTIVAFKTAIALGYDFLICMHSDGQAKPEDLDQFIPRSKKGIDFVFGNRLADESGSSEYSLIRLWGNRFFSWLQKRLVKKNIDDIGAYISFNLKTIASLPYAQLPFDMGYHPTLVLYAFLHRDIQFEEFPIRWGKVETSNVNPVIYGMKHLKRIFELKMGLFRLNHNTPEDFKSREISPDAIAQNHSRRI